MIRENTQAQAVQTSPPCCYASHRIRAASMGQDLPAQGPRSRPSVDAESVHLRCVSLAIRMLVFVGAMLPSLMLNWKAAHAADIRVAFRDASYDRNAVICNFSIVGVIERGDDEVFRSKAVEALQGPCTHPSAIVVFSPGGNVGAAMSIGEQIATLALTTFAPDLVKVFDHIPNKGSASTPRLVRRCETGSGADRLTIADADCTCASACFLIWLAGSKRQGDVVGLHRPIFDATSFGRLAPAEARSNYDALIAATASYLRRYGASEAIIETLLSTNSREVKYLSPSDLSGFRQAPYFEELMIAKCGISEREALQLHQKENRRTNSATDAFANLLTNAMPYFKCEHEAIIEMRKQSKAAYLNRYGQALPAR